MLLRCPEVSCSVHQSWSLDARQSPPVMKVGVWKLPARVKSSWVFSDAIRGGRLKETETSFSSRTQSLCSGLSWIHQAPTAP